MRREPGDVVHWARVALVLAATACTSHDPEVERRGPPRPDAGASGAGGEATGGGGAGGDGSGRTEIAFCQAEVVLRTSCQRCHSEPPRNGAPFALVTYEDTQQPYGSAGRLRWERMREAVESDFMPLVSLPLEPPVEPLTCEEKATLLGWLEQGAEAVGGTDCSERDAELVPCPDD